MYVYMYAHMCVCVFMYMCVCVCVCACAQLKVLQCASSDIISNCPKLTVRDSMEWLSLDTTALFRITVTTTAVESESESEGILSGVGVRRNF
jgi:hypothetical protein